MDAQLEEIGARCHFCSRQDFLPFQCTSCTHHFCLDHVSTSAHSCPVLTNPSTTTTTSSPSSKSTRGGTHKQIDHKTGPSLRALQDEHLARRGGPVMGTPVSTASSRKPLSGSQKSALETLRASLAGKFTIKAAAPSTVARDKMALSKLRNAARGDAGVGVNDRLHVYIRKAETQGEDIAYWVHRNWTVGRSLDAMAKRLGVVNDNARTQDEARKLHLLCDGLVLEPSQTIGKLVKEGSHITLFRGSRPING